MTTEITETIGRSALIAAASNYQSVAEALMEIIDNPFDKRRDRHLTIDVRIKKKRDRVTITDHGGEGMNDEGLRGWIRWGEGEDHSAGDIGQYRVGGKLAAIYLAESLEIVCRKAGETAIWRFHDPNWGSRTTALRASPLSQVPLSSVSWPDGPPPREAGFTHITLTGLKSHRYDTKVLRERLGDTYRSLIDANKCAILMDGEPVQPRHIPWSSSIDCVEIPRKEVCSRVYVTGRVGAIDRDQVADARGARIPAGIRTEFNGRKISDGEEFGFKLSGKGSLQRLYGEIEIQGRGIKPNQLKSGWQTDSTAWTAIEGRMREFMQPVITHLNSISESHPATREEKKRANSAKRRVEEAFKRLERLPQERGADSPPDDSASVGPFAPGGRKKAEPQGGMQREPQGKDKGKIKRRTSPPNQAVGSLLRRIGQNGQMPPIEHDALGPQMPRTQWSEREDKSRAVIINTDYPLYEHLGAHEDYVFDALVRHLVNDAISNVEEASELIDRAIWIDKEPAEAA